MESFRGLNQSSHRIEFNIKLKRNLFNEISQNLEKIIESRRFNNKTFYINMNKSYVEEFLKQLSNHSLFGFMDWQNSLKRNRFVFELDNLEIRLNINKYVPNKKVVVVNERYFTETYQSKYTNLYIEQRQWQESEVKDFINWSIDKGEELEFKQLKKNNETIYSISHKDFYRVIFEKNGVTKRSIEICGIIAKNKINNFIENYYG